MDGTPGKEQILTDSQFGFREWILSLTNILLFYFEIVDKWIYGMGNYLTEKY